MRNVTIKQMRAFVTLGKEGSFTKAAKRLNLSQSALTLQIQDFEAEIGLRLFDRSTRSVNLTAQGAEFLPVIDRIMNQLNWAMNDVQTLANRERGSVSVAAGTSIISLAVAPAVVRLRDTHPGILVRIMEYVGRELAKRVVEGEADFGLVALKTPSDTLDAHMLLKDRFGVLCAGNHPLAKKGGKLSWADLEGHPLVVLAHGTDTREILDRHPIIATLLPNAAYEVSSISALVALVEQGAGITLLPGITAYPAMQRRLAFRPIHGPVLFRELYFVRQKRPSLTPAARQLASTVCDALIALSRRPELKSLIDLSSDFRIFRKELDLT